MKNFFTPLLTFLTLHLLFTTGEREGVSGTHTHTHKHKHKHTHTHKHTNTHTHTHRRTYIRIFVYIHREWNVKHTHTYI
jgi:hypothetical protein